MHRFLFVGNMFCFAVNIVAALWLLGIGAYFVMVLPCVSMVLNALAIRQLSK